LEVGVLFLGFAGSRWTKFFTERYLSYIASIGVKLFVLYLIMGVGMSIAARWMPVLERGGFSPIPFFAGGVRRPKPEGRDAAILTSFTTPERSRRQTGRGRRDRHRTRRWLGAARRYV
jgi:hypothetical protein